MPTPKTCARKARIGLAVLGVLGLSLLLASLISQAAQAPSAELLHQERQQACARDPNCLRP